MFTKFKTFLASSLLLLIALTWQSCGGSSDKPISKEIESPEKKKLEAYMDSISSLQTRMSELIKAGKASTSEVNDLKASLESMQGQLAGTLNALKAAEGKNAELTAYVSKMDQKAKDQEKQISVLLEQVAKLEIENKDQKKTIDEQKTENESSKKTIEEQETVIKDIKSQKEFTVVLSSLQDKFNAAFEKAKASKGKDECNTFKEAYRYGKQIGELCEGKEAMVQDAGKAYATVMGFKNQVLTRAEADMSKNQYAKCFSAYK